VKKKYLFLIIGFVILVIFVLVLLYTCNLPPASSGATIQDGETGIVSKDGTQNKEKIEPKIETAPKPQEQKDTAPPAKVEKKETTIPADQFTLLMEYGGHRYYLSKNNVTWKEAFALCQQYGGHLVTITSDAENKAILEAIKLKNITSDIWIGFTDEKSEEHWEWVTGEKSAFAYWDEGQPDNWQGDEDYAVIWQVDREHNKIRYRWNDGNGKLTVTLFILEKE
jgi:hypothetical protein